MTQTELSDVQLRSPQAVAEQAGISVRNLRRLVREGRAPTPVRISDQRIGFYSHEIREWLSSLPRTRAVAA